MLSPPRPGAGGGGGGELKKLPTAEELNFEVSRYQAHLLAMARRNHLGVSGRWNGPDTVRRFAIEQKVLPRLTAGQMPTKDLAYFIFGDEVPTGDYKKRFDGWSKGIRPDPRCADGSLHAAEIAQLLESAAAHADPSAVAVPHRGRPNLTADPYTVGWGIYRGKNLTLRACAAAGRTGRTASAFRHTRRCSRGSYAAEQR